MRNVAKSLNSCNQLSAYRAKTGSKRKTSRTDENLDLVQHFTSCVECLDNLQIMQIGVVNSLFKTHSVFGERTRRLGKYMNTPCAPNYILLHIFSADGGCLLVLLHHQVF